MAVADLVGEWFATEPLRATMAAGGVSAPSSDRGRRAALPCCCGSGPPKAIPWQSGWFARAGRRRVRRLARGGPRGRRRSPDGAEVARVDVSDGDRHRRHALRRRETSRPGDRIEPGSEEDAPRPSRPDALEPDSCGASRTSARTARSRRSTRRVESHASTCGSCGALKRAIATLSGRVRLGPDIDYIEKAFDAARPGRLSDDPWIELTIPSRSPIARSRRTASTSCRRTCRSRPISSSHDVGRGARPVSLM